MGKNFSISLSISVEGEPTIDARDVADGTASYIVKVAFSRSFAECIFGLCNLSNRHKLKGLGGSHTAQLAFSILGTCLIQRTHW